VRVVTDEGSPEKKTVCGTSGF